MAFVVIYCETSGRMREAFRAVGHDAISVDILPAQDNSPHHVQADMFEHAAKTSVPDLAIFHPSCTYLTNSAAWAYGDGPYHQKVKEGTLVGEARRDARENAIEDVMRIVALPFPRIVIENPVGVLSTRLRKPDQIIHPWMFGDDASKATCLWLYGDVQPLVHDPKNYFPPRLVEWKGKTVKRWGNQTDSGQNRVTPSANRWQERSDTYPGIAAACAAQMLPLPGSARLNYALGQREASVEA